MLAAAVIACPARRVWPGGLTAREVEVLASAGPWPLEPGNRPRLVITPKTAMNHVEHIYAKLGVSTRAAGRSTPPSTG